MGYKNNLIALLVIQVLLIVLYRLFEIDWLFIPTLVFGFLCIAYALSIKCPSCGRGQVIRSMSIFDVKLPSEKCYYCKAFLNEPPMKSGSIDS